MNSHPLPTRLTYKKLHNRRTELRREIEEQECRMIRSVAYHLSPRRLAYRIGQSLVSGVVSSVNLYTLLRNIQRGLHTAVRYIEKLMT